MTPLLVLLGLCLLIVTPCYLIGCLLSPWGPCRRFAGNPRRRHTCYRCDGTGSRPRLAWRALAWLLRAWRDAR